MFLKYYARDVFLFVFLFNMLVHHPIFNFKYSCFSIQQIKKLSWRREEREKENIKLLSAICSNILIAK